MRSIGSEEDEGAEAASAQPGGGVRLTTLREVVLGRSMAVMDLPFLCGAGFAESG